MSFAARCASLPIAVRRSLAVLLLPGLLIFGASAVYLPMSYLQETHQAWRANTRQLLSQAASAPASQAALEQELQSMRQSALWSKFYSGNASMPAATELQADVRAIFSNAQASGQMLTAIPAEESPLFIRHGVQLASSLRMHQLQQVLSAIDSHPRFLHIARLSVVAPQAQSVEDNPPLAVTMDLYAYELKDKRRNEVQP